jgi:hypothetical protein
VIAAPLQDPDCSYEPADFPSDVPSLFTAAENTSFHAAETYVIAELSAGLTNRSSCFCYRPNEWLITTA